jgi:hypothetical protein
MRLQDQVIELKCKHMLHISCISEWLMKDDRCPLCMLKAIWYALGELLLVFDQDIDSEKQ